MGEDIDSYWPLLSMKAGTCVRLRWITDYLFLITLFLCFETIYWSLEIVCCINFACYLSLQNWLEEWATIAIWDMARLNGIANKLVITMSSVGEQALLLWSLLGWGCRCLLKCVCNKHWYLCCNNYFICVTAKFSVGWTSIIISLFFSPPPFFPLFFSPPSRPFLIEGVLGSKNLICESYLKRPKT